MGLRINTNVLSLSAQRNLGNSQKLLASALEKLASGSRINRAGDDAAGLSISEGLNAAVRGYTVAIRNANDAVGFLNTAEGALSNLTNIAQRLRELAIQAATGTLGANDRTYLDTERNQLVQEFDRVALQTNFNGTNLLDGTFQTTNLQVGISAQEVVSFTIGNARANSLGALATQSGAQNFLTGQVANMSINNVNITAPLTTDDTVSFKNNSFSSIAIAAEVNAKAGQTGVYADVKATVQTFSTFNITSFSGSLTGSQFAINNVNITGNTSSTNSFIDLVNSYAAQTGVTARLSPGTNGSVDFVAADGRNITLAFSNSSTTSQGIYIAFDALAQVTTVSSQMLAGQNLSSASATGLSTGGTITASGVINLRSSSAITIAGTNPSLAFGFTLTAISVNTATALNSLSVTTQANAQTALSIVDATLTQLNKLRASLGATQSRINSTATNLSVTVENLSAAKSQIRDTDIAAETANLTKAQILEQAGVAVLGQANNSSQVALKLLNF